MQHGQHTDDRACDQHNWRPLCRFLLGGHFLLRTTALWAVALQWYLGYSIDLHLCQSFTSRTTGKEMTAYTQVLVSMI